MVAELSWPPEHGRGRSRGKEWAGAGAAEGEGVGAAEVDVSVSRGRSRSSRSLLAGRMCELLLETDFPLMVPPNPPLAVHRLQGPGAGQERQPQGRLQLRGGAPA